MSDEPLTGEQPQTKPKHAGGSVSLRKSMARRTIALVLRETPDCEGNPSQNRNGYNKSLDEITKKKDAAVAQAEGLLRVVRYAARELKEFPANKRIEYAAQLMSFSL